MHFKKLIPAKIRKEYSLRIINKLKKNVKILFEKNIGFEPNDDAINYYLNRILNKEFSLNELPKILNPKKSSYYNEAREQFNINFFERKIFSQFGEDGIIDFIFSQIGTTNKFFVEFGVEDGSTCNTRYLLERKSWSGLMMDKRNNEHTQIKNEFITAENINELFAKYNVPKYFDLLSIDIDFNDYWVWKALTKYFPRVVVIEYNSSILPTESKVVQYDPNGRWDGTNYFGASILALSNLGLSKGYTLVGCSQHGVNAFFVKKELIPKHVKLKTVAELYRPAQYGMLKNGKYLGHPLSDKKMIEI